jgi:hypothetical protein
MLLHERGRTSRALRCQCRFLTDRRRRFVQHAPDDFTKIVLLEYPPLALEQPLEIYAVHFAETADLMMLEPQRRLDLFVGLIALRWKTA